MEINQQQQLSPLNEEQYLQMTKELRKNKMEMIRVLQQNPKVGVYLGETREEWDQFYTFFINFLRSEIGPRGQCAKLIRSKLSLVQAEANAVLLPFKQNAKTHIRQIYMKHKFFVPCEEYPQLLKIQQANEKFRSNLQRLSDKESPMRRQIAEGLIAKHGKDYDLEAEFNRLAKNYVVKIEEAEKEMSRLREILDKTEAYHQYIRVKTFMEPYFQQWIQADSNMGKQNLKTGQAFEDKVNAEMLPYLLAREKNDPTWAYSGKQFQIFTNVSWIPKCLGEIDIAFGYRDEKENRYFIFTLIQCKSRLFDLREAYKQVSLDDQEALNKGPTLAQLKEMKRLKQIANKKSSNKQKEGEKSTKDEVKTEKTVQQQAEQQRKQQQKEGKQQKEAKQTIGKKFLSTKYGPAELVEDHHFYIITTLPQNDFVLPIESKLKQGIEKYSKNRFIEDMQSEPLYQLLRQIFSERLSPLQWLLSYEKTMGERESNILVLH